jgi:hypothetical protein
MFTNGAYGIIARGEGGYRSIAGFDQMLRRARANYMSTIFRTLVYNNHILNIFMTIMLIAIAVMAIRNNHAKWHKITLYLVTTINLSYVVYTSMRLISPTWQVFLRLTDKFEALFTAFYFASIIIIILLGIKNSMTKNKILFLYSSIVILTSPLFLVTPIGERCFFPSYVLFIIIVCELYVYLADSYHWTYHHEDVIKKVTLVILAIMYLQIASIYIYIGVKDDERNRYGIDTDISLKIITYDEYYATIKTR